jgi:hypothetical protein
MGLMPCKTRIAWENPQAKVLPKEKESLVAPECAGVFNRTITDRVRYRFNVCSLVTVLGGHGGGFVVPYSLTTA